MSKRKTASVLIYSHGSYLFDRAYDHTSYLLIRLYAWCSKINPEFNLPLVNFTDYKFGSVPILPEMDIKWVVYHNPEIRAWCPSDSFKCPDMELDSVDKRFLGSRDCSLVKNVLDFKEQVKYFQDHNEWDFAVERNVDEVSYEFQGLLPSSQLIINDNIFIDVDLNVFRYNADSNHEDGFKRLKWFMDRLNKKDGGVGGIMPMSLFRMYAHMRWQSGKFRMPYIAYCKQFRTLRMNSIVSDKTDVMLYMKPEYDVYDMGGVIQPSQIEIDLLDPEYPVVYAIPFNVFRKLIYGKMKYKCENRETNSICHFMECVYPVGVFRFYGRNSKKKKQHYMFVLMGC